MRRLDKLFRLAISKPKIVFITGMLFIVLSAMGLSHISKDTSVDAFIPDDHFSIISRHKIESIFGLQDPIIISLENKSGSAFNPKNVKHIANTAPCRCRYSKY